MVAASQQGRIAAGQMWAFMRLCLLVLSCYPASSLAEKIQWNKEFGFGTREFGQKHIKRYFLEAGGESLEEASDHVTAVGPKALIEEFQDLCFWQITDSAFNKEAFLEKCKFNLKDAKDTETMPVTLKWHTELDAIRGQAFHEFFRRTKKQPTKEDLKKLHQKDEFDLTVERGSLQRGVAGCAVQFMDKTGKFRAASWCLSQVEVQWNHDYGLGRGDSGRTFVVETMLQDGGLIHGLPKDGWKAPPGDKPLKVSGPRRLICEFSKICVWTPTQPLEGCDCHFKEQKDGMLEPTTIKWAPNTSPAKKSEVSVEEFTLRAANPKIIMTSDEAKGKDIKDLDKFKASVQLGTIQRWFSTCAWCYEADGKDHCATWCPKKVDVKWNMEVGMPSYIIARKKVIRNFKHSGGNVDGDPTADGVTKFQVTGRRNLICEFGRLCLWTETSALLENCDCNLLKPPIDGKLDPWIDQPMHFKWVEENEGTVKANIQEFIEAEYSAKISKNDRSPRNGKFLKDINKNNIAKTVIESGKEFQTGKIHIGTLQRWYISCALCYAVDAENAPGGFTYNCPSWCTFESEMIWRKIDGYGPHAGKCTFVKDLLQMMGVTVNCKTFREESKTDKDNTFSGLYLVRLKTTRAIFCQLSKICVGSPKAHWLDGCDCEFQTDNNVLKDKAIASSGTKPSDPNGEAKGDSDAPKGMTALPVHIKWTQRNRAAMKAEFTKGETKVMFGPKLGQFIEGAKRDATTFIELVLPQTSEGKQPEDLEFNKRMYEKPDLTAPAFNLFSAKMNLGTLQRWYIACAWCYSVKEKAPTDPKEYKCGSWCPDGIDQTMRQDMELHQ